jgi:hypothetical protein
MFNAHIGNDGSYTVSHYRSNKFFSSPLSVIRSCLLWLRSTPEICDTDIFDASNGRPESTVKKQMGEEWAGLHANVQRRFATEPAITEQIVYRGTMETVECSFFGRLFAHLTRVIANPLTPYQGQNIPMDVTLYRKAGLAGVYWRRTYYYADRLPYIVTSVKGEDKNGHMTECVGAGFGMELSVNAEEGNLVFQSTHYFWKLGKLRIALPHWLSPGQARVIHEDLGYGTFRFTISMNHIYVGQTFYQTGVFSEV